MWLIWSLALLVTYLLTSTALSLAANYSAARKTGLPLVISPISKLNPIWLVLQRRLVPLMRRHLPPALTSWTRHNVLSWFFDDKYLLFSELGSRSWLHVTPRELEFHCADPAVNAQVFGRRADFDKPTDVLHLVDIYGPNISSVVGAEWKRHRRVTASPFNERNNRLVWDEALRQAGQVGACWSGKGAAGFNTTAVDTVAVSLNILATAALGESWDFVPVGADSDSEEKNAPGDGDGQAASYRESLHVLLSSIRTLVVTPKWVYRLPGWCIPSGYLSRFVETRRVFGRHMEEMVRQRKADIANGNLRTDDSTFLSALVLKSEEVRREEESGKGGGMGIKASLSNDELYGNLFTYNLAGHETTANSLSFSIYLLAAFPEWQEWVREEVDAVCGTSAGGQVNTAYEDVFPNLKRCRAFLVSHCRLPFPHTDGLIPFPPGTHELTDCPSTVRDTAILRPGAEHQQGHRRAPRPGTADRRQVRPPPAGDDSGPERDRVPHDARALGRGPHGLPARAVDRPTTTGRRRLRGAPRPARRGQGEDDVPRRQGHHVLPLVCRGPRLPGQEVRAGRGAGCYFEHPAGLSNRGCAGGLGDGGTGPEAMPFGD